MNGLKDDLSIDLNRQVYGNAQGTLAIINSAATSVTPTVKDTVWLQSILGAVVDVYDTLGTTLKATGRTITAINESTLVVTLSGANFAFVVGDLIVRTGNIGAQDLSVQREWTGLGNIVGSTALPYSTLYNVTDPVWTGNVLGNAGTPRALSEGLMTTAVDVVRKRGAKTSVLFSNLGVRRAYANLLVQQRRFTNTQEFKGGFSGLAFTTDQGDIPMVVDTYAPNGKIYGLCEDQLKWYREADWEFMDRDGSMWQRKIGFDAYQAYMYQYSELGTHRRNAHFVIEDIIEG
jgi:hypothetical protein